MVARYQVRDLPLLALPPQDFWNRAVVAISGGGGTFADFWPPQDFWNRAVVARQTLSQF